jgi:hypothetical protein
LCAIEGIGGLKADIGSGSFGLLPHGAFSLLKSRFWPSDFSPNRFKQMKTLMAALKICPFLRFFRKSLLKNLFHGEFIIIEPRYSAGKIKSHSTRSMETDP